MAIKVLPRRARAMQVQNQAQSYAEAQAQGRGGRWLANHPKIAARMGKGPSTAGISDPTVRGITNDAVIGNKAQGVAAAGVMNPTTSTPFGSTAMTTDANGNPIYTQTESDAQRAIREGGEGLTQTGLSQAQQNAANYKALDWQGSPEERARIEQEVYGRLTRNVDRDYKDEFDAMEQRMYNRGIPLDPTNPAYQREMNSLNEKYGALKENAAAQATILGGQEMGRSFDIAKQTHTTNTGDINTLAGAGIGYQAGNLPGFQAPNMPVTPTGDIAVNLLGQQTQKDIAQINANAAAGGGGEEEESPLT